jgi:imidazoleglycerol phosphate dehydratase HisB
MKPKLKLPGNQKLKLRCDISLSVSAFKSNLHRYTKAFGRCLRQCIAIDPRRAGAVASSKGTLSV